MGKYLLEKGNVCENNECIFADLSLLRQIFPHINNKLIKLIIYYSFPDCFVNKCSRVKKVFPDFRHGENIHSDMEILPAHLEYDISLPISFLKIDT